MVARVLVCLMLSGCASSFPEEVGVGGPVVRQYIHRQELPRCGEVTIHPQAGKRRDTECAF